jgi:mono/diheme cytochrome c family protein
MLPGLPKPPKWFVALVLIQTAAATLPFVTVAVLRALPSNKPRVHLIQNMDNQPRFKAQQVNTLFADRRASRPPVDGTVAIGELREVENEALWTGQQGGHWIDGFPEGITVDEAFIQRGMERYNIHCALCHGYTGKGNGSVNRRAEELALAGEPSSWVPPSNYHTDEIRGRANGHLYNTITNGVRNMAGYGKQIDVQDRWAIVAYVRALQHSQRATLEDVPPSERDRITKLLN